MIYHLVTLSERNTKGGTKMEERTIPYRHSCDIPVDKKLCNRLANGFCRELVREGLSFKQAQEVLAYAEYILTLRPLNYGPDA